MMIVTSPKTPWRWLALLLLLPSFFLVFAEPSASESEDHLQSARLTYHAFLGQSRAGRAVFDVSLSTNSYRVSGDARSEGLLETFNAWRADYFAEGGFAAEGPLMRRYYLYERDERKKREVTIEDGLLREIKNDKPRLTRPPLPGLDALTALFVTPRCEGIQNLHTGRHGYALELKGVEKSVEKGVEGDACRFRIVNEDGDAYDTTITFGERAGMRVPILIVMSGLLTGRMELASVEPSASTSATVSRTPGLVETPSQTELQASVEAQRRDL